jgi:two-component system response regulator AtoC
MNMDLIGESPTITNIRELAKVVADTGLSVIIHGETGVGKEVVARELHRLSNRRKKKFVKVNCAALPSELLESELFGYEKGAFTGATRFKPGKFEIASDGVIFLDEIGDIPLPLQAKLLHVLQSGEFSRLGGKDVKVDTWVITATNHDLVRDLNEGRFREDLYYRLNIIKIDVPPLRERKEDIPLLVNYYIDRYCSELEISRDFTIDTDIMDFFLQYDWPGNVRELSNTLKRLMVLGDWDSIKASISPRPERTTTGEGLAEEEPGYGSEYEDIVPLKILKAKAADYIERKVISHVLSTTGGNKSKAADMLDISYKALFYKTKNLGLR